MKNHIKTILLVILFLLINRSFCAEIVKFNVSGSVTNNIVNCLTDLVNKKMVNMAKACGWSALTSFFSTLKHPFIVLINEEYLSYIFLINSCDHLSSLLKYELDDFNTKLLDKKFMEYIYDNITQGLSYGAGKSLYTILSKPQKKVIFQGSTVVIGLNFICQGCGLNHLPYLVTPMLTAISTNGAIDHVREKMETNKTLIKSKNLVKSPLFAGTALCSVVAFGFHTYNVLSNEKNDIDLSTDNILSNIQQAIIFSSAYQLTTQYMPTVLTNIKQLAFKAFGGCKRKCC